jgi:hypothetical protein
MTGETYLGYLRTADFASPEGLLPDASRAYAVPPRLPLNQWALAGEWTLGPEAALLEQAGGRIAFRFSARDLHLVMGPATEGPAVAFRVLLDGRPPGADSGTDVDDDGAGTVSEPRLHQLIRQRGPVREHTFEIDFLHPGVQAYVFTFG